MTLEFNATLASTGSGNVTFSSTVDGGYGLTIDTSGVTTFTDAVGSGSALASLSTDAGGSTQINGGVVTTTGAQTYGNAVTLGTNTTLTANSGTSGQLLTFGSTLTGGGHSLAIGTAGAGTVTNGEFDNAVSGLSTLDVSGTTQIDTASITSSGGQTYAGAVTLDQNTTLTSAEGGILFTSAAAINSQSGENNNLTLDAGTGSVSFNANLGAIQPLGTLTVTQADGGVFFGNDASSADPNLQPVTTINASGQIDINSTAIAFDGGPGAADVQTITTTGGGVRINGPVTLDSSLTIDTAADRAFHAGRDDRQPQR